MNNNVLHRDYFYPRTVKIWNQLPAAAVLATSSTAFQEAAMPAIKGTRLQVGSMLLQIFKSSFLTYTLVLLDFVNFLCFLAPLLFIFFLRFLAKFVLQRDNPTQDSRQLLLFVIKLCGTNSHFTCTCLRQD